MAHPTVPLALLPSRAGGVAGNPGWQRKILALLESLPKAQRKLLAPLDVLAHELAALPPFAGALLPTLERAIFERTGERIARDAWDLHAVPSYLDFKFRVVDERDKVVGQGRDLAELQRTLGQRAKALWATAPRERFERTGLKSWDFELPASVTIDVGGRKLLAYPALVDAETAVDLRLLESPAAAAAATRDGLRRLFVLQANTSLAKLETSLPGALAKDHRRTLVLRALDEAFQLADPAAVPRDKATFTARLGEGKLQLPGALAQLGRLGLEVQSELDRARAALKPLISKPGLARTVVDDVHSQLAHLAPADVLRATPAVRLGHVVRYLKAIQVRLQRQAHDPQKDQQKAAQVVPLWQRYTAKRDELLARGRARADLDDYAWLVEELRVQVFAPELKTAVPVSVQRLQDLWTILSR